MEGSENFIFICTLSQEYFHKFSAQISASEGAEIFSKMEKVKLLMTHF
jgi:hypothetical protein